MTIECAFTGVLGRDGELKTSGKGKSYLKLNLRVAEADDAQWVSAISFDPDAVPQAGTFVIEDRIAMNEWTGQDGAKRFGLAAIANFSRLVAIGRHRPRDHDNGHRQAAARRRDDTKRSEPSMAGRSTTTPSSSEAAMFGPWERDIPPAERLARCRALWKPWLAFSRTGTRNLRPRSCRQREATQWPCSAP
jgi:hypothetical protein